MDNKYIGYYYRWMDFFDLNMEIATTRKKWSSKISICDKMKGYYKY